jgi:neutral trehalase
MIQETYTDLEKRKRERRKRINNYLWNIQQGTSFFPLFS